MADYRSRKLYQIGASGETDDPESYESMWAYSVKYPHAEYSTPGRYRIRITRMTAAEFIMMMGGDPSDADPDGYSLQGQLEKWTDKGWLQCLDWLGSPTSTNKEIEADLNEMFQSFTTGMPTEKNWDAPVPPRPPTKPTKKGEPKLKIIEGDKKETEENPPKKSDDSSFDWI
tara:strand:- start:461 stop:976 length:516 start_codon:yes stop_codon:yes gene_type:complete